LTLLFCLLSHDVKDDLVAKYNLRKGPLNIQKLGVPDEREVFIVNLPMITVPWWLGSTLETGAVAGWKA